MKYCPWFFITFFLFACQTKQSPSGTGIQKPDSLISRSQMVRILTDVHLTEAALAYLKSKGETKESLTEDYYNAVFSRYKISRKKFESNFNFYNCDQEDFIKMYEDVIKNLESLKEKKEQKDE